MQKVEPFQGIGNFLMWAVLGLGLLMVGSGLFRVFSNDPVNIPDVITRFGFGGVMILGPGVYLWRRRYRRRLKEKIVLRAIY
jgi:hypothetical protein